MEDTELSKIIQVLANSVQEAAKTLSSNKQENSFVPISMDITMPVHLTMQKDKPFMQIVDVREKIFASKESIKKEEQSKELKQEPGNVSTISISFKLIPNI